jgi:hypothetical protein
MAIRTKATMIPMNRMSAGVEDVVDLLDLIVEFGGHVVAEGFQHGVQGIGLFTDPQKHRELPAIDRRIC